MRSERVLVSCAGEEATGQVDGMLDVSAPPSGSPGSESVDNEQDLIGEPLGFWYAGLSRKASQVRAQLGSMGYARAVNGVVWVGVFGLGVEKGASSITGPAYVSSDGAHDAHEFLDWILWSGGQFGFEGQLPSLTHALEIGEHQAVLAGKGTVEKLLAAVTLVDDSLHADSMDAMAVEEDLHGVENSAGAVGVVGARHGHLQLYIGTDRSHQG